MQHFVPVVLTTMGGQTRVSAGISFGDARRLAVDQGLTGMKPLPP